MSVFYIEFFFFQIQCLLPEPFGPQARSLYVEN